MGRLRGIERELWLALAYFRVQYGYWPSLRELSDMVSRGTSTVSVHLYRMAAKGYISLDRLPNGARLDRGIVMHIWPVTFGVGLNRHLDRGV